MVLAHHHLDIRVVHLQFHAHSRCLKGKTAVNVDYFSQGILVGIDFVEARAWRNIVVCKICEEINVVWKITLEPEPLNGLFVLRYLLSSMHEDVEYEGTAALSGCSSQHR